MLQQGTGLPGGPGQPGIGMTKDFTDYRISFDEPSPERLFRFESEKSLERRMQQEARQRATPTTVVFPEQPTLSQVAFAGRSFPRQQLTTEPHFVNHARLYFQQINAERYGWDLGPLHPFLSAAQFYGDVFIWPYRVFSNFCDRTDSSAGRCLPGDPVPLLLYPPEILSLQGGIGQALITVPLAIAIP